MTSHLTLSVFLDRAYTPGKLGISAGQIKQLRSTIAKLNEWAESSPWAKEQAVVPPICLGDLSDELVRTFLADYAATHSPVTTNNKRRDLLALWRFAQEEDYVASPPGRIRKMKEPRRMPQAWRVEEVERLLTECRKQRGELGDTGIEQRIYWPALVLTVYDTGLRIGAVQGILVEDVNLVDHYLVARAECQKPYGDQACAVSRQTAEALWPLVNSPTRRLLFPWPFTPTYLWRRFRRIVEAAGLTAPRRGNHLFHKLRRTNYTYAWAADPRIAVEGAGHASEAVGRKHYLDPTIARQRSSADVLPRPRADPQLRMF